MASTDKRDEKRQIGGELIIPVLALAFTLYYVSTVVNSPWTAQLNAYMVGSVLIVLVLLFFGASNLFAPYEILPKRLAFIGLTLGYLVVIEWLGFTLTTFLFMVSSMYVLGNGRRPGAYLLTAVISATIALVVFVILFQKRFPKGPVEYFVQWFM